VNLTSFEAELVRNLVCELLTLDELDFKGLDKEFFFPCNPSTTIALSEMDFSICASFRLLSCPADSEDLRFPGAFWCNCASDTSTPTHSAPWDDDAAAPAASNFQFKKYHHNSSPNDVIHC
jgi:hypothetical protein